MTRKQKYCSDTHSAMVIYNGDECPLCQARMQADELLDVKQNIVEDNIYRLYEITDNLEKHLDRLEQIVLPQEHKSFWRILRPSKQLRDENVWNMQIETEEPL